MCVCVCLPMCTSLPIHIPYKSLLCEFCGWLLFQQVFVTSGLGGMSGAQAKAAVICGCVGVVAEASVATVTRDVAELLYKSLQILRTKNKF